MTHVLYLPDQITDHLNVQWGMEKMEFGVDCYLFVLLHYLIPWCLDLKSAKQHEHNKIDMVRKYGSAVPRCVAQCIAQQDTLCAVLRAIYRSTIYIHDTQTQPHSIYLMIRFQIQLMGLQYAPALCVYFIRLR